MLSIILTLYVELFFLSSASMASPFNYEGSFPSLHVKLSHLISVTLDEKNFKKYKQQIEGIIKGHKLRRFVTMPLVSPRSSPASILLPVAKIWRFSIGNNRMHLSAPGFSARSLILFFLNWLIAPIRGRCGLKFTVTSLLC